MDIGTKVRTTYQHSETGVIVKPRAENLPLPSPDWRIVRYDFDGKKACIHIDMMNIAND